MAAVPAWWPEARRCGALLPRAIERTFAEPDRPRAAELVRGGYPLTQESARIGLAAVYLARGDLAALERHVANARRDWRDVLVAAEYRQRGAGPFDMAPQAAYFDWIASLERA